MSDTTREIITLQVGHYANYVGTHWWNLQEASFVYDNKSSTDINHDFYFQCGLNSKGQETFTPRLIIIDSQGSLGSLLQHGTLYDDPPSTALTPQHAAGALPGGLAGAWDQGTVTVHQLPCAKNEFLQELEQQEEELLHVAAGHTSNVFATGSPAAPRSHDLRGKVHYWSDYLRLHLHPDTMNLLPGAWHSEVAGCADALLLGPDTQPGTAHGTLRSEQLWSYSAGVEAASVVAVYDETVDRIRRLAERCCSIQGFQILCHGHDGMGGVAGVVCEHLRDDYSNKMVLALPVTPPAVDSYCAAARTPLLADTLMTYSSLSQHSDLLLPLCLRQQPWRLDGALQAWQLYSYQAHSPYESSSLLGAYLDCLSSAMRTRHNPITLLEMVRSLGTQGRKMVCGALQLPAQATLGGGGGDVSGGGEDPPPHLAQVVARRGHSCDVPDDYRGLVRQLRDPVITTTPFPSQLFMGIPSTVTAATIASVSCSASAQQGAASERLVRELLAAAEHVTPSQLAHLAVRGVARDVWQDSVAEWQDVAHCYGDTREEEDSDY